MNYRFFIIPVSVVMLSACGGSNVSDQNNADSVAVTTPSEKDAQTEKTGIEYVNNRFLFSVTVPNDFVAQPDPENGDGRTFKRGNAQIIAYAGYAGSFDEVLALGGSDSDTYNAHKDNWAVWSGVEEGKIYYKKTVFKNGVAFSLFFEYPENEKNEFDSIISLVDRSWVTGQ